MGPVFVYAKVYGAAGAQPLNFFTPRDYVFTYESSGGICGAVSLGIVRHASKNSDQTRNVVFLFCSMYVSIGCERNREHDK